MHQQQGGWKAGIICSTNSQMLPKMNKRQNCKFPFLLKIYFQKTEDIFFNFYFFARKYLNYKIDHLNLQGKVLYIFLEVNILSEKI